MSRQRKTDRRSERGIALLIAIFVLLLISVVAIALLVSSGTETALGANYRSSSTVYYAALAGLEEARGRLVSKNPTYFGPAIIPSPFPLGQAVYVMNRLSGENVVPWDPSNQYYDKEYGAEFFPLTAASAGIQPAYSVWDYTNSPNLPGPVYKWVRITAATEQSLYLDVNSDGAYDSSTPIYYNPSQVDSHGNPAPSLVLGPQTGAVQVLQITALAYLPTGSQTASQKLLQYLVTPTAQSLSFPAALTLDGPNVPAAAPAGPLNLPYSGTFFMDGTDNYFYSSGGSCVLGANPSRQPVRGVGYAVNDANSYNNIFTAIHSNEGEYKGLGSAVPNVYYVGGPAMPSLAGNMQTLAEINALATGISQQADLTIAGPATQSDTNNLMPAGMSATNPMTVVVNGDFTENGWTGTGYGILLVTGTFTYDQNSSWYGIILVLGKGDFEVQAEPSHTGVIHGAVLIATTTDSAGNPLATLGPPLINYNDAGNQGIFYSSCWVNYVQAPGKYQVLSFHEIPQ